MTATKRGVRGSVWKGACAFCGRYVEFSSVTYTVVHGVPTCETFDSLDVLSFVIAHRKVVAGSIPEDARELRSCLAAAADAGSLEDQAVRLCIEAVEAREIRSHISCGLCGPGGKDWRGPERCLRVDGSLNLEHDRLVQADEEAQARAVAALAALGGREES